MAKRPANIYDLAREAGVSYGTVSRALNDRPGVNAQTRDHVLAVAERLRYAPSPVARGLANQTTAAIGLIIPGLSDPFFMNVTEGIQQVAQRSGYAVMITHTQRSVDAMIEGLSAFVRFRVSGVVLLGGPDERDEQVGSMLGDIPAVVALRRSRRDRLPSVSFNHATGMASAVQHLAERGRRRIAYVALEDASVASRERLRGYRLGLRRAGLPFDRQLVVSGGHTIGDGERATDRVIESSKTLEIDAVAYATDLLALSGLRRLREAGLRVPRGIAVTGFGDIPFARLATPSVTTVSVDLQALGEAAGDLLIERIRHRDTSARDVRFETRLIARESTS